MESAKARVTAAYARSLLDYLRARGLDPATLYPAQVIAQIETGASHIQVLLGDWVGMFSTAVAALGDPDLALKAGASVKGRHLGVLAQVLMGCATLADVIAQLARYYRLLGEIGQPRLEIRGDEAHLYWTWPYPEPPPPVLAQFMQATRVTFARWLMNRPDFTADAYFHFPAPTDTRSYASLFAGKLHFDQPESKLVFAQSYLQAPVVSADEESRQRAEAGARDLLRELGGEADFTGQLKAVLARGLGVGRASLEEAATVLNLSPRSLQRQLAAQGLSFREVLEQVRETLAGRYLSNPKLSLAEVAFLLGYTEQSTFQNAFRRWTGTSPGAFRTRAGDRGVR